VRRLITASKKDHKLIFLPEKLVERLNTIAVRKGVSVTSFAEEALEQSLRADEMGVTLDETVDTYRLLRVQRGSGAVQIPRSKLTSVVRELARDDKGELLAEWCEAGRWYGEYIHALLGDEAVDFLEEDLLVSWNLDEVDVRNDEMTVDLRFASFVIPLELTELLTSYIKGVMDSLGYEIYEEDCLRGLATLRFRKIFKR
jgi:hypothetical protein